MAVNFVALYKIRLVIHQEDTDKDMTGLRMVRISFYSLAANTGTRGP